MYIHLGVAHLETQCLGAVLQCSVVQRVLSCCTTDHMQTRCSGTLYLGMITWSPPQTFHFFTPNKKNTVFIRAQIKNHEMCLGKLSAELVPKHQNTYMYIFKSNYGVGG